MLRGSESIYALVWEKGRVGAAFYLRNYYVGVFLCINVKKELLESIFQFVMANGQIKD